MEQNQYRRGDIYYIRNDRETTGCEMRKDRPAIIVSNDAMNRFGSVVEVVYLTSKPRKDLPTHVTIRSTGRQSIALCEQVTSVATERLQNRMGTATREEMERVDIALMISVGIENAAVTAVETQGAFLAGGGNAEYLIAEKTQETAKLTAERDIYKGLYEGMLKKLLKEE